MGLVIAIPAAVILVAVVVESAFDGLPRLLDWHRDRRDRVTPDPEPPEWMATGPDTWGVPT